MKKEILKIIFTFVPMNEPINFFQKDVFGMKVEQMALKNENNFKRLKTCSHVEFNSEFNGIFFF